MARGVSCFKWMNSIYTRLLLVFLLMAVPLECGHEIIYRWCVGAVREEVTATARDNLSFIQDELETQVSLIARQLEYLLQNRTVTGFYYAVRTSRLSDYYMYIMDVQNSLKLMLGGSPFLERVSVYYPRLERVLSSNTYISIRMEEEAMGQVLNDFFTQGYLLVERSGELSVEAMHPASCYGTEKQPYYLASAALRQEQIATLLSSFDVSGDCLVFMVNRRTGTVYRNGLADSRGALPPEGLTQPTQEIAQQALTWDGVDYLCLGAHSSYLDCDFYQLIPSERLFALPERLSQFTRLFTLLLALFLVGYSFAIYRLVQRPINDLTGAFRAARHGDFSTRIEGKYLNEFEILVSGFNRMVAKIQELIQSTYESRIRTQQAEYKQLQSQINPHFLYNSFYLLRHSLRDREYEHAQQMCAYLGDYFRYITDQSCDSLPLSQELEHAQTYLRIQQMRFGDFLRAEIEQPDAETGTLIVPRLILQPLFENAIEHGVPTGRDSALVRLRFQRDGELVRIRFEDNGDRLSDQAIERLSSMLNAPQKIEGESHALFNTHRRLLICYGAPCGLSFSRSELGGLCVTLTIRRDGPGKRQEEEVPHGGRI